MNPGREIEDIVENLCKRSFFADFTIKSPKYYKLGGQQKEAADLLVAFKDTLLAIQIKSKQLHSSPARTGPIEQARVTKTIDKAIHQFRALVEAMRNRNFTSFVNGRGIEVPFNKSQLQEIHLIVVFAPLNGEDIDRPTSIRFNASCQSQARIPLHLFTLKQFELLLTLLDTLPDFLAYLGARWMLHAKTLIPEDSDPIDEWALITFERKKLVEML